MGDKAYVCQYRPAFFSGYENAEGEAADLSELKAIPFVQTWVGDDGFNRLSWCEGGIRGGKVGGPHWGGTKYTLMAEMKDGTFWVIAGIDDTFGLPKWVCPSDRR